MQAKQTQPATLKAQNHQAGEHGINYMPPIQKTKGTIQAMMGSATADNAPQTPAPTITTPSLNPTGLPNHMKTNLEAMSGFDMSDVRVHYNSPKPATIGALAYTQGNQIYMGPGQNQHLGHEAWHVVQQKQGRVKANTQFKGMEGNEDKSLEDEANTKQAKINKRDATTRYYKNDHIQQNQQKPDLAQTIQRIKPDELKERGKQIEEWVNSNENLTKECRAWRYENKELQIDVIGTVHSSEAIAKMIRHEVGDHEKEDEKKEIAAQSEAIKDAPIIKTIQMIEGTEYKTIYVENIKNTEIKKYTKDIDRVIWGHQALDEKKLKADSNTKTKWKQARQQISNGNSIIESFDGLIAGLALKGDLINLKELETEEDRELAKKRNMDEESTINKFNKEDQDKIKQYDENIINYIYKGDYKAAWRVHANYLSNGYDPFDIEERNQLWLKKTEKLYANKNEEPIKTLYIVGASHVPTLLIEFQKIFKGGSVTQMT